MSLTKGTIAVLALVLVVMTGCNGSGEHAGETAASIADDTPLEHAQRHFDPLYRCPMHPQITSDVPGDCRICGMRLVRVAKDASGVDHTTVSGDEPGDAVRISPATLQNLGVRYAQAELGALPAEVHAVGYVRYDERTLREVRIRAEGWVERLAVRALGERVEAGQLLFEIYSPALATAESELLEAMSFDDPDLIAASERRLAALGVDRASIAALRERGEPRSRLAFRAPVAGVVESLEVREGARVSPDMLALRIVALDPVWVIVEVAESNAGLVMEGAPVVLESVALPGRSFAGRIDYVYPELDPATRTLRARVVLENADAALKPDMYMAAHLRGRETEPVVHVPLESVIRGGRSNRVIVALGDGRFAAREVQLGREAADRIAVLSGLEPGERVVASGVFLIDSEASLRSSLGRLAAPAEPRPAGEPHAH